MNPASNSPSVGPDLAVSGSIAGALDDPRVVEALEKYMAALNAGARPDRQELLARFPDAASALAICLENLELIQGAAAGLAEPAGPAGPSGAVLPPALALGDFRIIRQIGHGGMAFVYEAEQLSLGRRVALKVLPLAGMMDPRHLQRFKIEAQAAAQLHHQHIVPIYFVGSERGVHFYAMQLIDGLTLAAVIDHLRKARDVNGSPPVASPAPDQPTSPYTTRPQTVSATTAMSPQATLTTERSTSPAFFREIARLAIQAAGALDHAHQTGVLHRDIKPSNLMIDGHSDLWVTDFGLARIQADAGLTTTGDLLGTLRYMSPEQALAKRVVVDHRTDIYSLGATLYELLTLQPVFSGRDREDILRQIAFEEPRLPRKVNSNVPPDLETIVLKALAKNPVERYTTAHELADDMRRFLDNRPVLAKRPTLLHRMKKWSIRHKAVLLATCAVFVLALAVGAGLLWQKQLQTEEALAVAESHRLRAEKNVKLARQAATRERAKTKEAKLERNRANANLHDAHQLVNRLLDVSETTLAAKPGLHAIRLELLRVALAYYKGWLKQKPADLELQGGLASVFNRIGVVFRDMGNLTGAQKAFCDARDRYQHLVKSTNADVRCQHGLAGSYINIGNTQVDQSQFQAALQSYQNACGIWETLRLAHDDPKVSDSLALGYMNMVSILLKLKRFDQAKRYAGRAVGICEGLCNKDAATAQFQRRLADAYEKMGIVAKNMNQASMAMLYYEKALRPIDILLSKDPVNVDLRFHRAHVLYNQASLLDNSKKLPEAIAKFQQARDILDNLVLENPSYVSFRRTLDESFQALANLHQKTNNPKKAIESYIQACKTYQLLIEQNPSISEFQFYLGYTYLRIAFVHCITEQWQYAEKMFRAAVNTLGRLGDIRTNDHDVMHMLAKAFHGMGAAKQKLDRPVEAVTAYKLAIIKYRTALRISTPIPGAQEIVRQSLGRCLVSLSRVAKVF